jgi:dethiobiotin synthetase
MKGFFVCAAGTGLGKTHLSALLIRQARAASLAVRALKPIASGFALDDPEGDPQRLLAALGEAADEAAIAAICPWRFAPPISPDMAAKREGLRLSLEEIAGFCRSGTSRDLLLVEGAGGVMTPLGEDFTNRDLAKALGLPALLVVGSYLGAISHGLAALEALRALDVPVAAMVVSESLDQPVAFAETCEAFARFAKEITILPLPRPPSSPPNFPLSLGLVDSGEATA